MASTYGRQDPVREVGALYYADKWVPADDQLVASLQLQYLVVDQLGIVLTGSAPREYVKDIRTTILYILNVLVTRQRPKFLMHMPEYKRAKARMFELGRKMVADLFSGAGPFALRLAETARVFLAKKAEANA